MTQEAAVEAVITKLDEVTRNLSKQEYMDVLGEILSDLEGRYESVEAEIDAEQE